MRVIEKNSYDPRPMYVDDYVLKEIKGYNYDGGALERVQDELEKIKIILTRLLCFSLETNKISLSEFSEIVNGYDADLEIVTDDNKL